MESFLITVGYGSVALLGTAIGVALLEHWRRPRRGRLAPPPVMQRAVHIDVDLGALLPAPGDSAARRATVDAAMARMLQGAGTAPSEQSSWIETRPMVGMAPETEPR